MDKKIEKSWFAVDGTLESIEYQGDSHFRFPAEVAEFVLNTYSKVQDWVLDPFAGFGTTVHVAQQLNRNAIGFEIDSSRAEFANKGLREPNKVFNANIETITSHQLPRFDFVFTSPPYVTVRLEDDPWGKTYFEDMKAIFQNIKVLLKPEAVVVVEVSNVKTQDGVRPLAWQLNEPLSELFSFQGEVIRCNSSDVEAGPGVNHSYLLVYKNSL